jgi:tetratricopeptide (TPR) repeat protein
MAKVSLRIYNRDIESLIDQGQLDEAIAHCRHILKTFPKHLETYRLLGKAYLEAKRYAEAVDIFQRVLAAVPDDFVSHVGMSIIHDEEGHLNEAIWHMERAFEVQPSNAAVQAELQRLYGRRDGIEPPKIRMTRGALAHMYLKGELYPQAIAEIKAVLSQDAERPDMQTLLARAYFYAGQKADASEVCNMLLRRYPYSFDANRILVELLQRSESAESTQVYRHRVTELDPYAAFTTGSIFYSNEVSDAAVSLERLVYQGQAVELGQEWGARSISLPGEKIGTQPDWLSQPPGGSFLEEKPAPVPSADTDIPDFLRQAGWTESSGAFQEGPSTEIEEEESLAPADIPDWLKSMAPEEAASAPLAPEMESNVGESVEIPDWLHNIAPAAPAEPPVAEEPLPAADIPDWLKGLEESATPAAPTEPPAAEEPLPAADIPDWLKGLEESATPAAPTEPPVAEEPLPAADIPDWLKGLEESATPAAPTEPPVAEEPLPATEGFDWMREAESPAPAQPVAEPSALSVETPAQVAPGASLDTLGTTLQEQEDAIAWLESLAAKHGAKPEELVTNPEDRKEVPPAWVEQAKAISEAPAAPSQPPAPQPEPTQDETGMWLRELAEQEAAEIPPASLAETGAETLHTDELPAWLRDTTTGPIASPQPFGSVPGEEPVSAPQPEAALPAEPEMVPELSQETTGEESELPDWLRSLEEEEISTPAVPADELPPWLRVEVEEPPAPAPISPDEWRPVEVIPPAQEEPPAESKKPSRAVDFAVPPVTGRLTPPPPPTSEPPAPSVEKPAATPEPQKAPSPQMEAPRPSVMRPRGTGMLTPPADPALVAAQSELNRGNIPAALEYYGKLIKKGRWLEEIIRDLREALYRYPIEVTIWQALGDAYMRANRLQDALDAYTKAEELLR